MFRIDSLTLFGLDSSQSYSYTFKSGINYIKGKNNSGKTEFYTFLDYMFGADEPLYNKAWYKDSLDHADITFIVNGISFVATRYLKDKNKNYIRYADESQADPLRLDAYKDRLNNIFAHDPDALKELRAFMGEDISYRTFTAFSFLPETYQGILNEFLAKSRLIEYKLKLPSILNFIFNLHLEDIANLRREEAELEAKLDRYSQINTQNDEIKRRANKQLSVLGIDKYFTGTNSSDILHCIIKLQSELALTDLTPDELTIGELQAVFNSLTEQIKTQKSIEDDCRVIEKSAQKQQLLLETLHKMVVDMPDYEYLISPITRLIAGLDRSVSFNRYIIQEKATSELKKERAKIQRRIEAQKSRHKLYSVADKECAITLLREYMSLYNDGVDPDEIKALKARLSKVRREIRDYQNQNDEKRIKALSEDITQLYEASISVSDISQRDFSKDGFRIKYLKTGNTLQPQIDETTEDGTIAINYYTGSMARHTLMQLCGYLAFLRLMIQDGRYPLIPFLVIDHLSKPFDNTNKKSIGAVIHHAYSGLSLDDLQIIMFDDDEPEDLGVTCNQYIDLVNDEKSGFNPFYHDVIEEVSSTDN